MYGAESVRCHERPLFPPPHNIRFCHRVPNDRCLRRECMYAVVSRQVGRRVPNPVSVDALGELIRYTPRATGYINLFSPSCVPQLHAAVAIFDALLTAYPCSHRLFPRGITFLLSFGKAQEFCAAAHLRIAASLHRSSLVIHSRFAR